MGAGERRTQKEQETMLWQPKVDFHGEQFKLITTVTRLKETTLCLSECMSTGLTFIHV